MPDTFQQGHSYRDPHTTPSDVGSQIRIDYWYKKALVDASKEAYFGQMANVRAMPKHMGKTIKQYHYMPLLDDRNVSDQGIDASGVSTVAGFVANVTIVKAVVEWIAPVAEGGMKYYFEGMATGADHATAIALAIDEVEGKAWAWSIQMGYVVSSTANYAASVVILDAAGWTTNELN
jgi:N4-gp56 family major capsid protein